MKTANHVLVTGGGSGLGLGIAIRYLQQGATVSVLDLAVSNASKMELQQAALLNGTSWQFFKADVTNAAELTEAVKASERQYGPPDIAINSAGVVINKTLADMHPEEFSRVININLNGSFNFAWAVLPTMKAGSRLALIASLAGHTSNYAYSAYGASKFGVVGLATTLRYEYEMQGINISCICPPEVNTPLVDGERLHGNPVSLELKKIAGSMQADVACDQIVAGLNEGRWMIIPGASGKATAFAARYLPGLFHRFMSVMIKKTMAKVGTTVKTNQHLS